MFIPNAGSRIPDPKTATKERSEKKIVVIPFFVATNFTKLKLFDFLNAEENIGPIFKEFYNFLPKKTVNKLSKIWVWDPGSGKNLFRIPDPGVKKAPDPKSRIRNTGKQFTNKILIWIRIIRGPWIRIQGGTIWPLKQK
jgi:hypothetical protein